MWRQQNHTATHERPHTVGSHPGSQTRATREFIICLLLIQSKRAQWLPDQRVQVWAQQIAQRFKNSKLSNQCNHTCKIYTEGYAWSVSLKYILACGSLPLRINPKYKDFKTAVEWENSHRAQVFTNNVGKKFAPNITKYNTSTSSYLNSVSSLRFLLQTDYGDEINAMYAQQYVNALQPAVYFEQETLQTS